MPVRRRHTKLSEKPVQPDTCNIAFSVEPAIFLFPAHDRHGHSLG